MDEIRVRNVFVKNNYDTRYYMQAVSHFPLPKAVVTVLSLPFQAPSVMMMMMMMMMQVSVFKIAVRAHQAHQPIDQNPHQPSIPLSTLGQSVANQTNMSIAMPRNRQQHLMRMI